MRATASGAVLLLFLTSTVVALASSTVLIGRLERVGARLGLTEAMLGLLAATAADGPEITSAVTALSQGRHDIGVGVVLGSNVFNLAALLGLGVVVAGRIRLDRRVVLLEGVVAAWLALVAVATVDGRLGVRPALLLALLVFGPYVFFSAVPQRIRARLPLPARQRKVLTETLIEEEAELSESIHPSPGTWRDAGVAALALAVVVGTAVVMEVSASRLGSRWRIPDVIIGGVVLGAVTSLPNAVAAVYLARRGRGAATLSEAMNSNAINTVVGFLAPAAVLGLATVDSGGIRVAGWYLAATLAVLATAWAGKGIGRRSGLLIIAGYVVFVLTLIP